jgi:hypothetical protein
MSFSGTAVSSKGLTYGTLIKIDEVNNVNIENIVKGDTVIGLDGNGNLVFNEIEEIYVSNKTPIYKLEFDDFILECSEQDYLYAPEPKNIWKMNITDYVRGLNTTYKINKISVSQPTPIITLKLKNGINFFANNILIASEN